MSRRIHSGGNAFANRLSRAGGFRNDRTGFQPRSIDLDATILVTPGHPANTIFPDQALGAGVDGLDAGLVARTYTPANVRAMRSAGLRPLTYRLRTELGIEAWHWSDYGRWSDPDHQCGYWTSKGTPGYNIDVCYGYRLPRRGNTLDQANNDGFSRLVDGEASTFWKSNPYLDHRFTHESDVDHPQWVVLDLGRRRPVNAIRVQWADPYAARYRVEFWQGRDEQDINDNVEGVWQAFPGGIVEHGVGGDERLRLCDLPISARYVRILMSASSGTACEAGTDPRDRCGYAIREVFLGVQDRAGRFHDVLRHGNNRTGQTRTFVSSTDPWHRACDRDASIEQPGFDRVFRSGLANGLPVLMPAGLLYDTPENGAAAIRYLRSRHYAVRGVEMGEEPDGQYVTPEDYGALYLQWADALHAIDPALSLGGPCFQSTVADINTWADRDGNTSWLNRFLNYLKQRHRTADLNFFSFEWYPFDDLSEPVESQLQRAPALLAQFLDTVRAEGLPPSLPCLMTEYGYSSFAGRAEVELPGALLNAEIAAQFLTQGGACAYLYGYEPGALACERGHKDNWGGLALFLTDNHQRIRWPMPTYYAARLLTQEWVEPVHTAQELYPTTIEVNKAAESKKEGAPAGLARNVTGYAVHRADGRWALLLINKSRSRSCSIRPRFADPTRRRLSPFTGPIDLFQYSASDYVWRPQGAHGRPERDLPPEHRILPAGAARRFSLPPYSLTVIRGAGPSVGL
jgi:hypothetical protein